MTNWKRLIGIVLAGMLLLSVGCACGEQAERPHITVSVYDEGNVPASEGTIEDNRWTQWINENGPVDVTFTAIPRVNPQEKLNVLYASDSAPDLVFEYAPAVKTPLYQQGMFMPIDDLIEQYSTTYKARMEKYPAIEKVGSYDDGRLYQFCRINNSLPNRCIVIRKDWLDNLGLEVPSTLEDLYNVAVAFTTQDPDGNGVDDTHGITFAYHAASTIKQMTHSNNVIMESNGQMQCAWDSIAERLDFQKRLYDAGAVDKEYLTDSNGARAIQEFVTGKLGIFPWQSGVVGIIQNQYKTLKQNVPEAEIIFIAYPETKSGRYLPSFGNPIQATAVISATCEDPKAVIEYVDFLSSEEFANTVRYGFEGEHYNLVDGVAVTISADKNKTELNYNNYYRMLCNGVDYALDSPYGGLNMNDPFEASCYDLLKQGLTTYFDLSLPYNDLTHSELMPVRPQNISMLEAGINLDAIFDKCIVGGEGYTVEQAIADAQTTWERGGGEEILAWWQDWYANDREDTILWEDIKQIIIETGYLEKLP